MNISELESKLWNLTACKRKMAPDGGQTAEIRCFITNINEAFQQYIINEEQQARVWILNDLSVKIEEHEDFNLTIGFVNAAITKTRDSIERLKLEQAARDAIQAEGETNGHFMG